MHTFNAIAGILCLLVCSSPATAQQDVDQCALNCIANVNGTNCSQSQWNCLCADHVYIDRVNNCTYASCDKKEQDSTFGAVAQICQVFGYTLTYGPEATASTNSDQIFSTQGILSESSLPPVLSSTTSDAQTGSNGYTIATAPSSPSSSGKVAPTSESATSATLTSPSGSASIAVATSSNGARSNRVGLALAVVVGVQIIFPQ